jgi:hypothetical protein
MFWRRSRTRTGDDLLRVKPWEKWRAVPREVLKPKGMIGPEERRCYYWLAKHWLSGQGVIVDAGAFVGASTFCFAAGAAAANRRAFDGHPIVHAYDYFRVVDDDYVREAISRDFRPINDGESYLDVFADQTRAHAGLIRTYTGDFLQRQWSGLPIEILFIDIAKSSALGAHAVAQFFPSLIPGRSIVVHQDYYHCWHPNIQVGMEYLAAEFELLDERVQYQSRVWRLAKPIPAEKVARLGADDLSRDERMALLDRLIARSSPRSRPMNELVRVWQIFIDGDPARARAEIRRVIQSYRSVDPGDFWAPQAALMEREIDRHLAL